jgi:tRNA-dihydrouridine synthase C
MSGCEDLMIGRGAVANPALALMIGGLRASALSWPEMMQLLQRFWLNVEQHIDARHRNGRIKQWLHYLTRHYPQAQQQFDIIRRVTEPAAIAEILFGQHAMLPPAYIQRVA